jgi:MFS family permease
VDEVTPPDLSHGSWLLGALDPFLVLAALWLGWRADQFGKVFIAAIAAFLFAVLMSWLVTAIGIPWVAPVSPDLPTFYPVRAVGALAWAIIGYGARWALRPR